MCSKKFAGERPCRSMILIKLLCNFIEIAFWHGCSPVNLLHIFRIPFYKNTCGGLLLTYILPFNLNQFSKPWSAFSCIGLLDRQCMVRIGIFFFLTFSRIAKTLLNKSVKFLNDKPPSFDYWAQPVDSNVSKFFCFQIRRLYKYHEASEYWE